MYVEPSLISTSTYLLKKICPPQAEIAGDCFCADLSSKTVKLFAYAKLVLIQDSHPPESTKVTISLNQVSDDFMSVRMIATVR